MKNLICSFTLGTWLLLGTTPIFAADSNPPASIPDEMKQPLTALLGDPLPSSLKVDQHQCRIERSEDGKLKKLSIEATLSRRDFSHHFKLTSWKEVPLSKDDREIMHLPSDTPKSYMTCFVGTLSGHEAKLLWSKYSEVLLLVISY